MKRKIETVDTKLCQSSKQRKCTIANTSVVASGSNSLTNTRGPCSRTLRSSSIKKAKILLYRDPNKKTSHDNRGIQITILDLPDEILTYIGSYLSHTDIFYNFRQACRRFYEIANDYSLWERIEADQNVPSETLKAWLLQAPRLKNLSIKNRQDFNEISPIVAKSCGHLQSLEVTNCWGAPKSKALKSKHLCRLITSCQKLRFINLSEVKVMSVKMFDMLVRDQHGNLRSCAYSGPISPRQLFTFLKALKYHELSTEDSILLLDSKERALTLASVFKELHEIENPTQEDFVQILRNVLEPDPNIVF